MNRVWSTHIGTCFCSASVPVLQSGPFSGAAGLLQDRLFYYAVMDFDMLSQKRRSIGLFPLRR